MLIGWATPFNIRSAIGKFSRFVGEELRSRGHDVRIIRVETGPELELDPLETSLEIVSAENVDVAALDTLVLNFGNHAPYHAQVVSLLGARPPLGIFHDAEMRDFAWGLQYRHGIDIPQLEGCDGIDNGAIDLVAPAARPLLGLLRRCAGAPLSMVRITGKRSQIIAQDRSKSFRSAILTTASRVNLRCHEKGGGYLSLASLTNTSSHAE